MTRYALYSDIHGNQEAFIAVLRDIDIQKADKQFCLGDIVGYGPRPNECCELVRKNADGIIIGNHDFGINTGIMDGLMRGIALAALIWTRHQLNTENKSFLNDLPFTYQEDGLAISHANFANPSSFMYVEYGRMERKRARAEIAFLIDREATKGFISHSHVPKIYYLEPDPDYKPDQKQKEVEGILIESTCADGSEIQFTEDLLAKVEGLRAEWTQPRGSLGFHIDSEKPVLVNIGSVGQPRDGDPRACYVIYDSETDVIEFHRVEYDLDKAKSHFLRTKMTKKLQKIAEDTKSPNPDLKQLVEKILEKLNDLPVVGVPDGGHTIELALAKRLDNGR